MKRRSTPSEGTAVGLSAWFLGKVFVSVWIGLLVTLGAQAQPTTADAGPDQDVCGQTTTLQGNTPTVGTGTWSVVSQPSGSSVTFSPDTGTPNAQITVDRFGSYTLRWTISEAGFPDSTDEVVITFYDNPGPADAGPNKDICALSTNMEGIAPSTGTGTWSVLSGPGSVFFADINSPTSDVIIISSGTYEFLWTVTNGPCPSVTDTVTIRFFDNPTADAGPDQVICSTPKVAIMAANTPGPGEVGTWMISSSSPTVTSATFSDIHSPTATFTGEPGGLYTLMWLVDSAPESPCFGAFDTLTVEFPHTPTPASTGGDQVVCLVNSTTLTGNDPSPYTGVWSEIGGDGNGSFADPNDPATTFSGTYGVSYTLEWRILSNTVCPDSATTMNVIFYAPPTTADAGPDQDVCLSSGDPVETFLAGNPPSATGGTGMWSILTGSGGTIASPTDPTSLFSGVLGATYELVWTITQAGGCGSSSDTVIISFYEEPTLADAGPDQTGPADGICGIGAGSPATLAANTPAVGTGTWTQTGGPGIATFADVNAPTTTVTVDTAGVYTFTWTISSPPCPDSSDSVQVEYFEPPTTAAAGPDQIDASGICGLGPAAMAANTPTIGTGTWTASGPGNATFTNVNDPLASVTVDAFGQYTFTWTISNGSCPDSVDSVQVEFFNTPTVADAGPDQTGSNGICGTGPATMAANTPIVGSGTWTLLSGPGSASFADPYAATTEVSVTAFGLYTFQWTIAEASSACPDSTDTVDIEFFNTPTVADAGPDQTGLNGVCDFGPGSPATLAANTPTVGTGTWTASGPGSATFTDVNDPNTDVTVDAAGIYTFTWTVSNGTCPDSTDTVDVEFHEPTTPADAGTDQLVCVAYGSEDTFLSANPPVAGETGTWSVVSAAPASPAPTFDDINDPNTGFHGQPNGVYTLRWTISPVAGSSCPDTTDEVIVTFNSTPTADAGLDQIVCGTRVTTLAGNDPAPNSGQWTILTDDGGGVLGDPNVFDSTFSGNFDFQYELVWTVFSNDPSCPDSTDEVDVIFRDDPTVADAGPDQALCINAGDPVITTLAANAPAPNGGVGSWSIVSGSGGVIIDPGSPTSQFTGVIDTVYELMWTITQYDGCGSTTDTVLIGFTENPVADAGPDITVCAVGTPTQFAPLMANMPSPGTGMWSEVAGDGSGVFDDPADPNTVFTGTAGVTYTLRWTVTNGSPPFECVVYDEMTFDVVAMPQAYAGSDQTICTPYTNLSATAVPSSSGTCEWSIVSGDGLAYFDNNPGQVTSTIPLAPFAGTPGVSYVLRWTCTNGFCSTSDEVTINILEPPIASAGADQQACGTSTTLQGGHDGGVNNLPAFATGTWSIVGPADGMGLILDPTDPESTFLGTVGQTYTLRWTVVSPPCNSSTDEVNITFLPLPDTPDGGPDQIVCAGVKMEREFSPAREIPDGTGTVFQDTISLDKFDTVVDVNVLIDLEHANVDDLEISLSRPGGPTVLLVSGLPCGASIGSGSRVFDDEVSNPVGCPFDPGFYSPMGSLSDFDGQSIAGDWILTVTDTASSATGTVRFWCLIINEGEVTLAGGPDPLDTPGDFGFWEFAPGGNPDGLGYFAGVPGLYQTATGASGFVTQFNGSPGQTYTVQFTTQRGDCTSSDPVTITFEHLPSTAVAGSDQLVCGTSTMLMADVPTWGTGTWTIQSGTGGIIADVNAATSTFEGLPGEVYILRWTVENASCSDPSNYDEVRIEFFAEPTPADAGPDQYVCGGSTTLMANALSVGTGQWSFATGGNTDGSGVIDSPSDRNSIFTGTPGVSYTLLWTVSDPGSPCPDTTDEVVIRFRQTPTVADAGPDQVLCGATTTLEANTPTAGTGEWSFAVGGNPDSLGAIADPTDPHSTFTGTPGVTYRLVWTISNHPCTPSSDEVSIRFTANPTVADVGPDRIVCNDFTNLEGNTPVVGAGVWTFAPGGNPDGNGRIYAPSDPNSLLTGTLGVDYTLRWTISNPPCPSSYDDVTIGFREAPDIVLTKSADVASASEGETILFTLTYENIGVKDASGIVLTEIVPDYTVFEPSLSTPGWVCSPNTSAGSTCTLQVGMLPAGATASVIYAVSLADPIPAGVTMISNTATIIDASSVRPDPNLANNTSGATVPLRFSPVFECPGDLLVSNDPGVCGALVDIVPAVTGYPEPVVVCTVDGLSVTSPHFFPVGTSIVECTAVNSVGTDVCRYTVTVVDVEPPQAVCQPAVVRLDENGIGVLSGIDVENGSFDNCLLNDFVVNPATFTCADIGAHTVTLTVTDVAGNSDSCTTTVTVVDEIPPTIQVASLDPIFSNADSVPAPDYLGGVTVTDNCTPSGDIIVTQSPPAGGSLSQGENVIVFTAEDQSGNISTATQTVRVGPAGGDCDSGYYILDSLGGRHRVGNPPVITGPVYFGTDLARDFERAFCEVDGLPEEDLVVLDGFGMAHFVQHSQCSIPQDFYFGDSMKDFPQGRAVDIEVSVDSTGFWVLTDYGEIYRAGTVKNPSEPSALGIGQMGVLGFDVPITGEMRDSNLPDPGGASLRAVAFVVIDSDYNGRADGYIILDSMGGHYQRSANGAFVPADSSLGLSGNQPDRLLDPNAYVWPYFAGLDIARDLELHPGQGGVLILDGWGGIHPVPVDVETNPVFFATNLTSVSDPTPRQVPGMPYVQSGFDDPETPENEGDAGTFGIDAASIFRDIEFSAGCAEGLYALDSFGGVFVLGDSREVADQPVPQFGNSPYFFPFHYAEAIEVYEK